MIDEQSESNNLFNIFLNTLWTTYELTARSIYVHTLEIARTLPDELLFTSSYLFIDW